MFIILFLDSFKNVKVKVAEKVTKTPVSTASTQVLISPEVVLMKAVVDMSIIAEKPIDVTDVVMTTGEHSVEEPDISSCISELSLDSVSSVPDGATASPPTAPASTAQLVVA